MSEKSREERKAELERNLASVQEHIAEAARTVGRSPEEITLLPVTKFHPAEDIELLAELGITDVAENREQEARDKAAALPQMRIHMIGQIQSKKANSVARWAAGVESVDSARLADHLDHGMELALDRGDRAPEDLLLPVFIQLSYDGDEARGGVPEKSLGEVIAAVEDAEHLSLSGLMVVPPLGEDAGVVFRWARNLCDSWDETLSKRLKLSAGMSQDYALAIENGSDIVRVGTGILGPRPLG